jgi:hypothetical protein
MAEGTNQTHEPTTLRPWALPGHDVSRRRRASRQQLLSPSGGDELGCEHVWKRGRRAATWHCIRCQARRPAMATAV